MRADGEIADNEARLFQALLAKPYYLGDETWHYLESAERRGHAEQLAIAGDLDTGCIGDQFEDEEVRDKLTLLSHLYLVVEIDGRAEPGEDELYADLRDDLDGDGWFDGPELGTDYLEYVERSVHLALHPSEIGVDPELEEVVSALEATDILPFLTEIPAEVAADFACGFEGDCD
jgi:hypothetical protein